MQIFSVILTDPCDVVHQYVVTDKEVVVLEFLALRNPLFGKLRELAKVHLVDEYDF